jgi:hypothetical protein
VVSFAPRPPYSGGKWSKLKFISVLVQVGSFTAMEVERRGVLYHFQRPVSHIIYEKYMQRIMNKTVCSRRGLD